MYYDKFNPLVENFLLNIFPLYKNHVPSEHSTLCLIFFYFLFLFIRNFIIVWLLMIYFILFRIFYKSVTIFLITYYLGIKYFLTFIFKVMMDIWWSLLVWKILSFTSETFFLGIFFSIISVFLFIHYLDIVPFVLINISYLVSFLTYLSFFF